MKLLKLPALDNSLPEAIQQITKSNPTTYIMIYIDPKDDQITVSRYGKSGMEQVGLLELVKHTILHGD